MAKGRVNDVYLPSAVLPQIALSVENLCFSGYEKETVIKSAIALAIAKDCFLEFRPNNHKEDVRERLELIFSYKRYEGEVRFSDVIDTTIFILSLKGYENPKGYLLVDKKYSDVVIFERKTKI